MNSYPEMDSFTLITRTFDLTITSVCTDATLIAPSPNYPTVLQWVWDQTLTDGVMQLIIRDQLEINDTGSLDAMERGNSWPTNPFFCGLRAYTFNKVLFT